MKPHPIARTLFCALACGALAASLGAGLPATLAPSLSDRSEVLGQDLDLARYDDFDRHLGELEVALPGSADALYWRGRKAVEMCGDGESALPLAEQALALDPKRAEFHVLKGDAIGLAAARNGMFRAMRKASIVKGEYDKAIELAPDLVLPHLRLIQYCLIVPGVFGGGKDKAREQANRVLELNPFRGHMALAAIARKDGKDAEAEKEYGEAATVAPGDARPWTRLSEALLKQKRFAPAEEAARKAVAAAPGIVFGWLALAKCLKAEEKVADALQVYRDAEKKLGVHPFASYEELEMRLSLPEAAGLAESADRLARSVATGPRDCYGTAQAQRLLGDAYAKLKRTDEARRCYEACLAVMPDDKDAKRGLKKLG